MAEADTARVAFAGGCLTLAAATGAYAIALASSAERVRNAPVVTPKEARYRHLHELIAIRGSVEPVDRCVSTRVGRLPSVSIETTIERVGLRSAAAAASAASVACGSREAAVVSHEEQYVDWFIQGDGDSGRAGVEGAESVARFTMDDVTLYRTESSNGLRMYEKSLPCGSRLTAIGQATPPPEKQQRRFNLDVCITNCGGILHVSRLAPGEIVRNLRVSSRILAGFSLFFASLGGSVVLWSAARVFIRRRRIAKRKRELAKIDSESTTRSLGSCLICYEQEIDLCLPCGHIACCSVCFERINRCPVCRRHAPNALKVFLP